MSQHHDPVHPDSEHLPAEVLADLDLGLLDDASAEHARHHLEQCTQCAQLHDDLAALTHSLGSLSASGTAGEVLDPMPDDVWHRLESALATEPALTPEGAATVVPMAPVRKRRFGRPGIGVVAAVAGVALVGAIAVPTIRSMNSNDPPIRADSGDSSSAEDAGRTPTADAFRATRSGTKYDEDSLDTQVNQLVAARSTLDNETADTQADDEYGGDDDSASPGVSPTSTAEAVVGSGVKLAKSGALATSPAAAQACLEGYLGLSDVTPLAIDIGLWDGKPAAVIVLPKDDPTLAEVWVIKPSCSTANAEDPLIYYATITR
jgi:hypothetical protein